MSKTTEVVVNDYELMHSELNERIGYVHMTSAEHAEYVRSNPAEGHIRLGSLAHHQYDLDEEHKGTHEDTNVFIADW